VIIRDERELIKLGRKFGAELKGGEVIELVGDIGAGKTTFTKGIAQALGVTEEVNSPSFTVMKEYEGVAGLNPAKVYLKHYDFYRLDDAGLMKDEISESIGDGQTITMVEWAKDVAGVLPENRKKVEIKYLSDGDGREVLGL
jgi:tRNA threonylcarbamoyladenosine biosynthesis protein TsaE